MEIIVDLQLATDAVSVPTCAQFEAWVQCAVDHAPKEVVLVDPLEVTLRVVEEAESAVLNKTYRRKEGPTNVLSFPFEAPEDVEVPLLGDIVICAPLVVEEAEAQGKVLEAHWAHLCLHGCLHLLGYDHECKADAKVMEALEVELLHEMGYANPYEA